MNNRRLAGPLLSEAELAELRRLEKVTPEMLDTTNGGVKRIMPKGNPSKENLAWNRKITELLEEIR